MRQEAMGVQPGPWMMSMTGWGDGVATVDL